MKHIEWRIWCDKRKKYLLREKDGDAFMLNHKFQTWFLTKAQESVSFELFTGKIDEYGNKIFEGDIIADTVTDHTTGDAIPWCKYLVIWSDDCSFMLKDLMEDVEDIFMDDISHLYVIGNKNEDIKLLEREK